MKKIIVSTLLIVFCVSTSFSVTWEKITNTPGGLSYMEQDNTSGRFVFTSGNNYYRWTSSTNLWETRTFSQRSTQAIIPHGSYDYFVGTNYGLYEGSWGTLLSVYQMDWQDLEQFVKPSANTYLAIGGGGVWRYTSSWTNTLDVGTFTYSCGYPTYNCYLNEIRTAVVKGTTTFVGGLTTTVLKSTNDGASWTYITQISSNAQMTQMTTDGTNLYALTTIGVYKSTNDGATWTAMPTSRTPNFSSWSGSYVRTIAYRAGYLYIGVTATGDSTKNGVYNLQISGGTSWTRTSGGLAVPRSQEIQKLYNFGDILYLTTFDGLYRGIAGTYPREIAEMESEQSQPTLQVIPNPVTSSFQIHSTSGFDGAVNIAVLNTMGQKLLTYESDASSIEGTSFNISSLNAGIYFVVIKSGDIVMTEKIIKE